MIKYIKICFASPIFSTLSQKLLLRIFMNAVLFEKLFMKLLHSIKHLLKNILCVNITKCAHFLKKETYFF